MRTPDLNVDLTAPPSTGKWGGDETCGKYPVPGRKLRKCNVFEQCCRAIVHKFI